MSRVAKASPRTQPSSNRVGTAEFRTNLAKYLELARAGHNVVILQRGRSAFVLSRFEEAAPAPVLGCLRNRTEYAQGAVLNAKESWDGGGMP